jgi:hypothetical protein
MPGLTLDPAVVFFPDPFPEPWASLSRGFWLADTACTQALSPAVTGANASAFKDDT